MISVNGIKGEGKAYYYLKVLREEPESKLPPQWYGKGASKLGLTTVDNEEFLNLYRGFSPDGKTRLVRNAGDPNRQVGSDFCFSVSKSVSITAELSGIKVRQAIQDSIIGSIKKTLSIAEGYAVTKRDLQFDSAELVIALFPHAVSRANDMQTHVHALVMNVATRSDGTTGAIMLKNLFNHEMRLTMDALFQAELAATLENRLGLQLERKGNSFEIKGISAHQLTQFSKRRKEVLAAAKSEGPGSYKTRQIAALHTRKKKVTTPKDELIKLWRAEADTVGLTQAKLTNLLGHWVKRDRAKEAQDLLALTLKEVVRQNSTFEQKDVLRAIGREAIGRKFGADEVLKLTDQFLSLPDVVALGEYKGKLLYSTKDLLDLEHEMMRQVVEASNRTQIVPINLIPKVLSENRFRTIKEEQREALLEITARSGGVKVVYGMAGTGKTYLLAAARSVWELAGYSAQGITLSGKAAEGLEAESGIKSSTIAAFLKKENSLTSKSVLLVDEAGMVGTADMLEIVRRVHGAGAKLVLVGDNQQLQPIGVGGGFSAIQKALGYSKLSNISRQTEVWMLNAVYQFARGEANEALKAYTERGLVTVANNSYLAMRSLVSQWREAGGVECPHHHIILSGTNKYVDTANLEAQRVRQKQGLVRTDEGIEIHGGTCFVGDRVVFRKNMIAFNVKNGTFGKVIKVDTNRNEITVKLDNNEDLQIILLDKKEKKNRYKQSDISLGYAVTTHKAQGVTAKNAYVLTSPGMQHREISYVQMSRHRENARIFTTRKEAGDYLKELASAMSRSREKKLAISIQTEISEVAVLRPTLQH